MEAPGYTKDDIDISIDKGTLSISCLLYTSLFDEELKKDGIISNTTYVSLLNTNTHLLISLVNETNKYEEFLERLKDKLNNMEINEKDFKRKKKVLISNRCV